MDDPENEENWQTAPSIMHLRVNEMLNLFDKVRVKSYQIGKFHDTPIEVPIFGSATISLFLH